MAEDRTAGGSPRPPEDRAGRSSYVDMAFDELGAERETRSLKIAWIAALIFHFALFIIVFPEMGGTLEFEEERDAVVIKRYKPPEPPKQQPEKKVVKRRTSRVPIPDPTPDQPEPIVSEEEDVVFVEDFDPADSDFVVGMPEGPPVVDQGPMRVGGDIQAPEKIQHVDPVYPELARRARLTGVVVLEATIDTEGNVVDVNVLRGLGLGLDQAAVDAVSKWKYRPTYYNGRPVPVLMTVTVQFQLQ